MADSIMDGFARLLYRHLPDGTHTLSIIGLEYHPAQATLRREHATIRTDNRFWPLLAAAHQSLLNGELCVALLRSTAVNIDGTVVTERGWSLTPLGIVVFDGAELQTRYTLDPITGQLTHPDERVHYASGWDDDVWPTLGTVG